MLLNIVAFIVCLLIELVGFVIIVAVMFAAFGTVWWAFERVIG